MGGLDVGLVVIALDSVHPSGLDMVGHDFARVGKRLMADSAAIFLLQNFFRQKPSHGRWTSPNQSRLGMLLDP
jgi:hypothetical protein